MVLRSFANFSKCSRSSSTYIPRRASGSSYTHPFFNPSYVKPKVAVVEDVAKESKNKTKHSSINPALSVSQNYIVLDPSRKKQKDEDENNSEDEDLKIIFKKANNKSNRNSHVNVSIQSITATETILNIRRSNSSAVKTLTLNNSQLFPSQTRTFATTVESTTKEIEEQLAKLKITEQQGASSPETLAEQQHTFPQLEISEDLLASKTPLEIQDIVIDNLMSINKNNEVLAVYFRMRGSEMVPTIHMYNKILKAIQLRTTTETSEEKLTHLLNVYSDMLSNNLKPDEQTYELVIEPLLNGSLHSNKLGKFNEGFDFFKIAMELFLISHGPNHTPMTFNNDSIYLNILRCLNSYQCTGSIQPKELYEIVKDKIPSNHLLEFYVQLIRFTKYSNDLTFISTLYEEMNSSINATILELNQFKIYSCIVESLTYCGEFAKGSKYIDQIINKMEDKTSPEAQLDISRLLSSYIKSQSKVNPTEAYKTLMKFESIQWLPDVSVSCLVNLFKSFIDSGDIQMSARVWNFMIIRSDFDKSIELLNEEDNYNQLANFLNNYVDLLMMDPLKDRTLKLTREIISKESLLLGEEQILKLVSYLQYNNYQDLTISFLMNQGYKLNRTTSKSLNNYISLLVDLLSPNQFFLLLQTRFFKKAVEEYRLINDNIYGLIKMFNYIKTQQQLLTDQLRYKLLYYIKVLSFEFDDASNHYINLPDQLKEFKQSLIQFQTQLTS